MQSKLNGTVRVQRYQEEIVKYTKPEMSKEEASKTDIKQHKTSQAKRFRVHNRWKAKNKNRFPKPV